MKPLHVAVLVVVGALCGAGVMRVWQRPRPVPAPAPAAAPAQPAAPAPEPVAAQPVAAPPVATPAVEPQPPAAPAPGKKHVARAAKPAVRHQQPVRQEPVRSEPVTVAQAGAPPAAPVVNPPAPVQNPPARTEPENVTPSEPAPPPPPEPHRVTLNTGMLIPVRLVDGLSSERNTTGDLFIATLDKELVVDGFVIAERGARVEGRVVNVDRAGKVRGVAALSVELTAVHTSDGQRVPVQTERFDKQAESTHQQDAAKVAAGAAVGAVIGAIAGGGKGAAIGAGVGGGAGAGDVLLTRGKPATIPTETRLSFRLRAPVTITEKLY
jgi:hypothetical protein